MSKYSERKNVIGYMTHNFDWSKVVLWLFLTALFLMII